MERNFHHTSFLRRPERGVVVTDRVLGTLAESRHVVQDFTNERDEEPEMTIDDSVFTPVAARTNLYRDEACNAWRIRIPERANIALDTVVAHARGPRRNHAALVFEDDDATVGRYSFGGSGCALRPLHNDRDGATLTDLHRHSRTKSHRMACPTLTGATDVAVPASLAAAVAERRGSCSSGKCYALCPQICGEQCHGPPRHLQRTRPQTALR